MKRVAFLVVVAVMLLVSAWVVDRARYRKHYVSRVASLPAAGGSGTVGEVLSERHADGHWTLTPTPTGVAVSFESERTYRWECEDGTIPFPLATSASAEELTPLHLRVERILERAREQDQDQK